MYCRNYTGTISCVLCREVHHTVSLFGRVHYQRFCCMYQYVHTYTRKRVVLLYKKYNIYSTYAVPCANSTRVLPRVMIRRGP